MKTAVQTKSKALAITPHKSSPLEEVAFSSGNTRHNAAIDCATKPTTPPFSFSKLKLLVYGAGVLLTGNAVAATRSVTFSWKPAPAAAVSGTNYIWIGNASGNYTRRIPLPGLAVQATITNLIGGREIFFAVQYQGATGRVSRFSNELTYKPPGSAASLRPAEAMNIVLAAPPANDPPPPVTNNVPTPTVAMNLGIIRSMADQVLIVVQGSAGQRYFIETAPTDTSTNWNVKREGVIGDSGVEHVIFPSESTAEFFRTRKVDP